MSIHTSTMTLQCESSRFLHFVLATQMCPTLFDSMNCSPPGSSVHGILQASILEWVAIPFSRGFSWHRYRTQVSCILGVFFTVWVSRERTLSLVFNCSSNVLEACSLLDLFRITQVLLRSGNGRILTELWIYQASFL